MCGYIKDRVGVSRLWKVLALLSGEGGDWLSAGVVGLVYDTRVDRMLWLL